MVPFGDVPIGGTTTGINTTRKRKTMDIQSILMLILTLIQVFTALQSLLA
jgi:hypothetical protein